MNTLITKYDYSIGYTDRNGNFGSDGRRFRTKKEANAECNKLKSLWWVDPSRAAPLRTHFVIKQPGNV